MNTHNPSHPEMRPSLAQQIVGCLFHWKVATARQIYQLLGSGEYPEKKISIKRTLNRLRRNGSILSVRAQDRVLNFCLLEERRFKQLSLQPPERVRSYLSASGITHHLVMLDLFLGFKKALPGLHMYANPLSDIHLFSERSRDAKTIRCAPDLSIVSPWNPAKLICIEYERSQKKTTRYDEKWSAYEFDRSVSRVLYIVSDKILLERLSRHIDSRLGSRRTGSEEFSISLVCHDQILSYGLRAAARTHFFDETVYNRVSDVLTEKNLGIEALAPEPSPSVSRLMSPIGSPDEFSKGSSLRV